MILSIAHLDCRLYEVDLYLMRYHRNREANVTHTVAASACDSRLLSEIRIDLKSME